MRTNIDHNFTYHTPNEEQVGRYNILRSEAKALAHIIDKLVPESREQSLAITHLEEAIFWANAGIARNE